MLDTSAAIDSAVRQLSVVDACGVVNAAGSQWLEADQIRFVRIFLEEGIGEFARFDREQSEVVAECVMLAGDNMQDARLSILEQKHDEKDGGFFDFLVNLGIMLALELLLVSTAIYAVPALVALVSGRIQARKARELVSAFDHRRGTESGYRTQYESLAEVVRKAVDKRTEAERLWDRRAEGGETYFLYKRAVRELKKLENDYAVGLAALERSVDLAKQANQAVASASSNPLPYLSSDKMRAFMHGAVGETIVNRVAENSAVSGTEKIVAATAGAAAVGRTTVFQTSTLLGRFLAEIRNERNRAAEKWSRTRFHIRFLSDDDLVTSEIAQELFFRIHYDQSATMQGFSFVDREFLVLGMEGALWLAWLCHIKALGQESVNGRLVRGGARKGEIHGDLFVTDFPEGVSGVANGISYPGLLRISDSHAEYLYGRFAKPFYVANPGRAPEFAVPLGAEANTASGTVKFNQLRYDEVASMAPTFLRGVSDPDRLGRVAEMKLLAIKFFQLLAENRELIGGDAEPIGNDARKVLRELLEIEAMDDIIDRYLEPLPPVGEFGPPVVVQSDQECLAELADALETVNGRDEKWLVGDARSQLEVAVGNLDMKITTYPLLHASAATGFSADRAVAENALREIERAQQEVRERHAAFLGLAAGQPDAVAEVAAQLGDRISVLTNWSHDQIAEGTWKYYPPAETPPVS